MTARIYENKIVVIAGGASGIGKQLALQLNAALAYVIVLDRDEKAGAALSKEVPSIEWNQVDFTKADIVKRSIRQLIKKHGRIDYFFNCAGVFMGGEIRDTPIEDWNRISISNLSPIWNGTSIVYAAMQKQGFGHIINIASAAGLFPVPAMHIYGAAKAAVISLTLGLRIEAKTLGIKASVVCPTIVKTPLYNTATYPGADRKKVLAALESRTNLQTPEVTARRILQQVARNKAVIQTALSTRLTWAIFRLSSQAYGHLALRFLRLYRRTLRVQG